MRKIDHLLNLIEMVDELLRNRVNHEEEMYTKTHEKNIALVANRLDMIEEQKEYLFAVE